jgi:putative FmdB family regulatory protein
MTYVYRCPQCGEIELEHPMGSSLETCPGCGADIERVFTAPQVKFVGDGWTPKHYHTGK